MGSKKIYSNSKIKDQFLLNPEVTFLNFGSFGACPKPVFHSYQNWQTSLERDPVQFITKTGIKHLEKSREALAEYLNCSSQDLVFVTNPSYAANIVAKSFPLNPDDEILSTALEYGACDKTWNYYCKKSKAKFSRQHISLPVVSSEKLTSELFSGVTPRTKAIFISHITSSTALILPVSEICSVAKQKGLITIVDGAHGPGQVPVNLKELDADIYIGACHKWMMTPKGCSFLYVRKDLQSLFDPLVISWGFDSMFPSGSRFLDYHQLQGTRDFSAFLTVPEAIRFMKEYDWSTVASNCRQLVRSNAERFCSLLNSTPLAPVSEEFTGQMFSIPVKTIEPEKLQTLLYENYKIEIPVMRHGNAVYMRFSINGFNDQHDLDKLYIALEQVINETTLLAK